MKIWCHITKQYQNRQQDRRRPCVMFLKHADALAALAATLALPPEPV